MKAKSTLIIMCLALAFLMIVGTTRAEAQCCWGDAIAAPFVAAGAIVEGAVVVSAAVVTAPFTALSCGSCGISLCSPCSNPVTFVPSCDHC
ncbi:MAG: hypothetical protein ABSF90_26840 [Syntrophobacteraceae bacterium]|jgi:hypothetical protein